MILVILEVNGKIYFAECPTLKAARWKANEWLLEAKKSYPHKEFTPRYYRARRV